MRYVQVYSSGYPRSRGRVYEHRLIYENYHKCCLLKWTDVHHINGIKTDNRPENLVAMIHGRHTALSVNNRADHSNTKCLICGGKTYL